MVGMTTESDIYHQGDRYGNIGLSTIPSPTVYGLEQSLNMLNERSFKLCGKI